MICMVSFVIGCHVLFIHVARRRKWFDGELPEVYKFPHIEIMMFLVLSMGMLDVGFAVLTTPNTAIGWKVCVPHITACIYPHTHTFSISFIIRSLSLVRLTCSSLSLSLCFILLHIYTYTCLSVCLSLRVGGHPVGSSSTQHTRTRAHNVVHRGG
jgi:hypothetical protein